MKNFCRRYQKHHICRVRFKLDH